MNTDNIMIVNGEERILFIGSRFFSFLSTKKSFPLGSAGDKLEIGDILVFFTKNSGEGQAVGKIKELCPFKCSAPTDSGLVLICCLEQKDLLPIAKSCPAALPDDLPLVDTVYESNEIRLERKKNTLLAVVNGQTVSFPFHEVDSMYAIVKEGAIRSFGYAGYGEDLGLFEILSARRFPPWINEEAVLGQKAGKVLNDELYKVVRELENETGKSERYLNMGAKTFRLTQAMVCVQNESVRVISIHDSEDILGEMSEYSAAYKQITGNRGQGGLPQGSYHAFKLLGNDDKIKEVTRLLQKSSVTNTTILLTGESGTGKTFIAGEIHKASRRNEGPFIHVNCAAIPYHLMESELFGYEEGAFTGAKKGGKKGYFEMAYGGTLFLDEIGEIPLQLQGKLLEVLQSRTFYHVGGMRRLTSDVRVIAATNKDLKEMVRKKQFREDLFYRINVFPIDIPPLRERRSDLYSIVMDILPNVCSRLGCEPLLLSSQAYRKILLYPWPGNIRELENVLEKAAILSDGRIILPDDILLSDAGDSFTASPVTLQEIRESAERGAIVHALGLYQGDKIKAAEYLDIGRTNMFDKIKKYHIHMDEAEI